MHIIISRWWEHSKYTYETHFWLYLLSNISSEMISFRFCNLSSAAALAPLYHCSKHRQEAGQTLCGLQPQHTLSWLRHRPPPHSHLLGSQIFFQQTFNKWTVTSKNFLYIWYFLLEFATTVIKSFSPRKIIYSILFSLEIFLTSRSLNLPWVPIPSPHPDHSFFPCSTQSLCIYLTDTFNTHPSLCHIKASNIQW